MRDLAHIETDLAEGYIDFATGQKYRELEKLYIDKKGRKLRPFFI